MWSKPNRVRYNNRVMKNFFYNLLFKKQPASFHSAYDVQESVRRLSAVVGTWPFLSPFRQSLVGKVKENKVVLARFIPFVSNPFAPVFHGSFQVREGATVLEGYFALPLYSRIFHACWLGFCLIMAVILLIGAIIGPVSSPPPLPQWQSRLILGLGPAFMILLFVLYVKASKWFARNAIPFIAIPFIAIRIQRVLQAERG